MANQAQALSARLAAADLGRLPLTTLYKGRKRLERFEDECQTELDIAVNDFRGRLFGTEEFQTFFARLKADEKISRAEPEDFDVSFRKNYDDDSAGRFTIVLSLQTNRHKIERTIVDDSPLTNELLARANSIYRAHITGHHAERRPQNRDDVVMRDEAGRPRHTVLRPGHGFPDARTLQQREVAPLVHPMDAERTFDRLSHGERLPQPGAAPQPTPVGNGGDVPMSDAPADGNAAGGVDQAVNLPLAELNPFLAADADPALLLHDGPVLPAVSTVQDQLRAENAQLRQENAELRLVNANLKFDNENHVGTIQEMSQANGIELAERDAALADAEARLETIQNERAELQSLLTALRSAQQRAQQDHHIAQQELQTARAALDKLRSDLQISSDLAPDAVAEALRALLDGSVAERARLAGELARREQELEDAQDQAGAAEERYAALQVILKGLAPDREHPEQDLSLHEIQQILDAMVPAQQPQAMEEEQPAGDAQGENAPADAGLPANVRPLAQALGIALQTQGGQDKPADEVLEAIRTQFAALRAEALQLRQNAEAARAELETLRQAHQAGAAGTIQALDQRAAALQQEAQRLEGQRTALEQQRTQLDAERQRLQAILARLARVSSAQELPGDQQLPLTVESIAQVEQALQAKEQQAAQAQQQQQEQAAGLEQQQQQAAQANDALQQAVADAAQALGLGAGASAAAVIKELRERSARLATLEADFEQRAAGLQEREDQLQAQEQALAQIRAKAQQYDEVAAALTEARLQLATLKESSTLAIGALQTQLDELRALQQHGKDGHGPAGANGNGINGHGAGSDSDGEDGHGPARPGDGIAATGKPLDPALLEAARLRLVEQLETQAGTIQTLQQQLEEAQRRKIAAEAELQGMLASLAKAARIAGVQNLPEDGQQLTVENVVGPVGVALEQAQQQQQPNAAEAAAAEEVAGLVQAVQAWAEQHIFGQQQGDQPLTPAAILEELQGRAAACEGLQKRVAELEGQAEQRAAELQRTAAELAELRQEHGALQKAQVQPHAVPQLPGAALGVEDMGVAAPTPRIGGTAQQVQLDRGPELEAVSVNGDGDPAANGHPNGAAPAAAAAAGRKNLTMLALPLPAEIVINPAALQLRVEQLEGELTGLREQSGRQEAALQREIAERDAALGQQRRELEALEPMKTAAASSSLEVEKLRCELAAAEEFNQTATQGAAKLQAQVKQLEARVLELQTRLQPSNPLEVAVEEVGPAAAEAAAEEEAQGPHENGDANSVSSGSGGGPTGSVREADASLSGADSAPSKRSTHNRSNTVPTLPAKGLPLGSLQAPADKHDILVSPRVPAGSPQQVQLVLGAPGAADPARAGANGAVAPVLDLGQGQQLVAVLEGDSDSARRRAAEELAQQLQGQLTHLRGELQQAQARAIEATAAKEEIAGELEAALADAETQRGAALGAQGATAALAEKLATLQSEQERAQQQLEAERAQLGQERARLEEESGAVARQEVSNKERAAKILEDLAAFGTQQEQAQAAVAARQATVAELEGRAGQLQARIEALTGEEGTAQKRQQARAAEIARADEELTQRTRAAEERLGTVKQQQAEAAAALQTITEQAAKQRQALEQARHELEGIAGQKAQAAAELEAVNGQLDEARTQLEQQQAALAQAGAGLAAVAAGLGVDKINGQPIAGQPPAAIIAAVQAHLQEVAGAQADAQQQATAHLEREAEALAERETALRQREGAAAQEAAARQSEIEALSQRVQEAEASAVSERAQGAALQEQLNGMAALKQAVREAQETAAAAQEKAEQLQGQLAKVEPLSNELRERIAAERAKRQGQQGQAAAGEQDPQGSAQGPEDVSPAEAQQYLAGLSAEAGQAGTLRQQLEQARVAEASATARAEQLQAQLERAQQQGQPGQGASGIDPHGDDLSIASAVLIDDLGGGQVGTLRQQLEKAVAAAAEKARELEDLRGTVGNTKALLTQAQEAERAAVARVGGLEQQVSQLRAAQAGQPSAQEVAALKEQAQLGLAALEQLRQMTAALSGRPAQPQQPQGSAPQQGKAPQSATAAGDAILQASRGAMAAIKALLQDRDQARGEREIANQGQLSATRRASTATSDKDRTIADLRDRNSDLLGLTTGQPSDAQRSVTQAHARLTQLQQQTRTAEEADKVRRREIALSLQTLAKQFKLTLPNSEQLEEEGYSPTLGEIKIYVDYLQEALQRYLAEVERLVQRQVLINQHQLSPASPGSPEELSTLLAMALQPAVTEQGRRLSPSLQVQLSPLVLSPAPDDARGADGRSQSPVRRGSRDDFKRHQGGAASSASGQGAATGAAAGPQPKRPSGIPVLARFPQQLASSGRGRTPGDDEPTPPAGGRGKRQQPAALTFWNNGAAAPAAGRGATAPAPANGSVNGSMTAQLGSPLASPAPAGTPSSRPSTGAKQPSPPAPHRFVAPGQPSPGVLTIGPGTSSFTARPATAPAATERPRSPVVPQRGTTEMSNGNGSFTGASLRAYREDRAYREEQQARGGAGSGGGSTPASPIGAPRTLAGQPQAKGSFSLNFDGTTPLSPGQDAATQLHVFPGSEPQIGAGPTAGAPGSPQPAPAAAARAGSPPAKRSLTGPLSALHVGRRTPPPVNGVAVLPPFPTVRVPNLSTPRGGPRTASLGTAVRSPGSPDSGKKNSGSPEQEAATPSPARGPVPPLDLSQLTSPSGVELELNHERLDALAAFSALRKQRAQQPADDEQDAAFEGDPSSPRNMYAHLSRPRDADRSRVNPDYSEGAKPESKEFHSRTPSGGSQGSPATPLSGRSVASGGSVASGISPGVSPGRPQDLANTDAILKALEAVSGEIDAFNRAVEQMDKDTRLAIVAELNNTNPAVRISLQASNVLTGFSPEGDNPSICLLTTGSLTPCALSLQNGAGQGQDVLTGNLVKKAKTSPDVLRLAYPLLKGGTQQVYFAQKAADRSAADVQSNYVLHILERGALKPGVAPDRDTVQAKVFRSITCPRGLMPALQKQLNSEVIRYKKWPFLFDQIAKKERALKAFGKISEADKQKGKIVQTVVRKLTKFNTECSDLAVLILNAEILISMYEGALRDEAQARGMGAGLDTFKEKFFTEYAVSAMHIERLKELIRTLKPRLRALTRLSLVTEQGS